MESNVIPKLFEWMCRRGYISSGPKEIDASDYMDFGSENVMITGAGKLKNFNGCAERVGEDGGIIMQTVAENYASLGQVSDVTAFGSVFNAFAALMYIGKGLLRLNGASLLVLASSTLSLLIKRGGTYTDPASGPWQAGLAQPSAPIIYAVSPPAGFTGKNNGVVSVVIWRVRSTTGAVSIRSEPSNILTVTNESVAVQLPLADSNGQDYWGIGVTKNAEGRVGAHFELTLIPESTVAESLSRSDLATNNASLNVTSAVGGFTSEHIGWVVAISGGTPAVVHSSYVTAVPNGNTLTLNAMPPTTSVGANLLLSRGSGGTARTVVVEWRDGDLVGKELAPARDFPPPAGLFAGSLEDVAFIDGCYADAVDATTSANPGSAIAPSERGKPESYSPDTVIFTNDSPTALLRGDGLYWRWGRNSLMVIRYLGGAEKPLSVEPVWEGIGILHQHNTVLGEGGRLYAWAAERGLVRMAENGLPETAFAIEVADDFEACTDPLKRVLGWYNQMQALVCFYEKQAWPYFTMLRQWGAPADLTGLIDGNVKSCIAENNELLISDDLDNLYEYNVGTGSVAKIRTGWMQAKNMVDTVHSIVVGARCDNTNDITIRTFADGDDSAPADETPVTPARTGYQRLDTIYPNVVQCESYAVEIEIESTTATGDVGIEKIVGFGDGDSYLG